MNSFKAFLMLVLLMLLSGCQVREERSEVTDFVRTPTSTDSPEPLALTENTLHPTFTALPVISSPVPTASPRPPSTPNPTLEPALWRCMPDGNIDPCKRPFFDISMLSTNEGWLVGHGGAIFYWNGDEWQPQIAPTDARLQTVKALDSENAWASGQKTDGTAITLHWDGTAWADHPVPTSRLSSYISDMSFVSANDGWAIVQEWGGHEKADCYFLHWDGQVWTRIKKVETALAIYMLSAQDGWATGEFGTLYHWDGRSWEVISEEMIDGNLADFDRYLSNIFFTSSDKGWVIGEVGGIMTWDGSQWHIEQPLPFLNVNDIFFTDQQGWIVGVDRGINHLYRWDGTDWFPTVAPPDGEIEGLAVLSENDIWAVGHNQRFYPVVWHWEGAAWTSFYTNPSTTPIEAIAMTNETHAWGVGENGYIGYWDGQQWDEFPSPTTSNLHGVDFIAPDNGWAVGDQATMLHWNGESWILIKQLEDPPYATLELQDVSFVSDTEVWAAGGINSEGGTGPLLIHLQWDGQTWQELPPQTPYCNCYFKSIAMLSANDGWAVGGGDEATTIHWDGSSWQIVPNPGGYWLYSIVPLAPDDVWSDGIHWDGQEWVEEASLTIPNPLPSTPTGEEWLKGKWILANFFWNGTSWTPIQNFTTHPILDADMAPSGQAVALTNKGTWLRLNE